MVKPPQPAGHTAFLWQKPRWTGWEKGDAPAFKQMSFGASRGGSGGATVPPVTPRVSCGQRQSGELVPAASVKHISHRRFLATFQLDSVSQAEQDLYRCVTQSARGAGVSNFAELIVKGG